ncbi:IclR family transcriptional regulator [Amycolatopsis viridis]|uniref:DNA-binding IclR family transcriptional regulator n=1 Tax=Amycolatopsis viridis TaxID=185678 RepID=A0ABX0SUR3_9PSEU|nr:IclR family transcriptional regulator [Amycolatopsis viridis]NIH79100.1 DNA-binding IclR family transcriptional regulator [Amycolatopsis viridis]
MDKELDTPVRGDRGLGSVANALRLIEALAATPEAGVSELARELGLTKPSVDRLLTTMVSAGFVEQNGETRKYRLTVKLVSLADSVRPRIRFIDIARPYLVELSERFHETVNLGVLSGDSILYADTIPSSQMFRIDVRAGSRLPAYCTAMGKAILAFSDPTTVAAYLRDFTPMAYTRFTTPNAATLREQLAEVRRSGYALDEGEILEEVCCIAAPILDADGHAVASVSITAPRSTFHKKLAELTAVVPRTVERISEQARTANVQPGAAS